jgi:hypothetical protein
MLCCFTMCTISLVYVCCGTLYNRCNYVTMASNLRHMSFVADEYVVYHTIVLATVSNISTKNISD